MELIRKFRAANPEAAKLSEFDGADQLKDCFHPFNGILVSSTKKESHVVTLICSACGEEFRKIMRPVTGKVE